MGSGALDPDSLTTSSRDLKNRVFLSGYENLFPIKVCLELFNQSLLEKNNKSLVESFQS